MVNASPALKHTRLRDDAQLYVERLLFGFEPCDLNAATGPFRALVMWRMTACNAVMS